MLFRSVSQSRYGYPFNFSEELPDLGFKAGNHEFEAAVVHGVLSKLPRGCSLDLLILLRDEIGLTRQQVLLGFMELRAADRIKSVSVKDSYFAHYKEDYAHWIVKDVHRSTILKNRFRSFEGQYVARKK